MIENYKNVNTNYQILQILCEKFYWKLQTFKYKLPNIIEIMWEIILKITKINTNYKNLSINYQILQRSCEKFYWKLEKKLNTNYRILQR